MTDLPIIRLLPKIKPQRIRFGMPWVYADQVVMDRRTRNIEAGSIAILQDANRTPLAVVGVTPESKIIGRVLDRNTDATIDQSWLEQKIAHALQLRETLFDAPFYRLIHAEADGLPGVIIDRFGDTAVIQPNAAWADRMLDQLVAALIAVSGVKNVVKNASGRARKLEGLDQESAVLAGDVVEAIPVQMNGATYLADVIGGQKTGLFYDQRPNHAFAANLSTNHDVLDVFSHVGGFSLAVLANGAKSALAVDGSADALELAAKGAEAMGVSEKFETRKGDAFDTMAALLAEGRTFDHVICDPPAFAPSKQALEAGLRAYERVARLGAQLVRPGGYLSLCSCSHAADLTKFREASLRGVGKAARSAQIIHTGAAGADHPTHPYLAESSYLKSVFLRLD